MKIRAGFVSNSSSTAFILDLQDERVQKAIKDCPADKPTDLNRCTALAVGNDAVEYAKGWIAEMEYWGSTYSGLGQWILYWADTLGQDNIVFARESDEGMGGWLEFPASEFALDEMEYH